MTTKSTVSWDKSYYKIEQILSKISILKETLLTNKFKEENICLFMSQDIVNLLIDISNNYNTTIEIGNTKISFMGYPVKKIKEEDAIYIGLKVVDE